MGHQQPDGAMTVRLPATEESRSQRFAASSAIAAAAVRVSTRSPSRMCSTCFETVRELMPKIIPISGLVLPTAT